MVKYLADILQQYHYNIFAGIDARGFWVAAPLAYHLQSGMFMIRKTGKLPPPTIDVKYDLEYGEDNLAIIDGLIEKNKKVILCDDVLATGGTLKAAYNLCQKAGLDVVCAVIIVELENLAGRDECDGLIIHSLLQY